MEKTRLLKALLVSAMALCSARPGICENVLFDQPPSVGDGGFGGSWNSMHDNFTVPATFTIGRVTWAGFFSTLDPDSAFLTGFNISIYGDNGFHQPGAQLFSQSISGTAHETLSTASIFPTYTYSATLPTGFQGLAGNEYWIAISPSLAVNSPNWAWMYSATGDGVSWPVSGFNMAFTLFSIPEPGFLAMLSLGLTFFLLRLRPNRRQP